MTRQTDTTSQPQPQGAPRAPRARARNALRTHALALVAASALTLTACNSFSAEEAQLAKRFNVTVERLRLVSTTAQKGPKPTPEGAREAVVYVTLPDAKARNADAVRAAAEAIQLGLVELFANNRPLDVATVVVLNDLSHGYTTQSIHRESAALILRRRELEAAPPTPTPPPTP